MKVGLSYYWIGSSYIRKIRMKKQFIYFCLCLLCAWPLAVIRLI